MGIKKYFDTFNFKEKSWIKENFFVLNLSTSMLENTSKKISRQRAFKETCWKKPIQPFSFECHRDLCDLCSFCENFSWDQMNQIFFTTIGL